MNVIIGSMHMQRNARPVKLRSAQISKHKSYAKKYYDVNCSLETVRLNLSFATFIIVSAN